MTAGASAPEDLVQQVIASASQLQRGHRSHRRSRRSDGICGQTPCEGAVGRGHEVPREGISIDADRVTRDWMEREAISFTPITAEGGRL